MSTSTIPFVVEQHAEELSTLWATRDGLAASGHIRLKDLARFDERIAAHEDGCVVGMQQGARALMEQLDTLSAGNVFAVTVVALGSGDNAAISRCVALAEASPEARRGMVSALGWVNSTQLRGVVKGLLSATNTCPRILGLAACRLHGVSPGGALRSAVTDPVGDLRAEAVRTAGVLGERELASAASSHSEDDAECRFWSAWAAVLHGGDGVVRDALAHIALEHGARKPRAFRLLLQAMSVGASHGLFQMLRGDPLQERWLIEGSGIAGDPGYVPWLIDQMTRAHSARLAGEAFCVVTGVDLRESKLDGAAPEGFEPGPNDDPDDPNVDADQDEGLPWPDPGKVEQWWVGNASRFRRGQRYFMGAPVTWEHCLDVLTHGYQRQRILAAHYLCLLRPGTLLFNTSAPAWRQQRLLASM